MQAKYWRDINALLTLFPWIQKGCRLPEEKNRQVIMHTPRNSVVNWIFFIYCIKDYIFSKNKGSIIQNGSAVCGTYRGGEVQYSPFPWGPRTSLACTPGFHLDKKMNAPLIPEEGWSGVSNDWCISCVNSFSLALAHQLRHLITNIWVLRGWCDRLSHQTN